MTTFTSQPEPAHLARASLMLARVLAGNADPVTRRAAAAAVVILGDVHPPYPPHLEHLEPVPAEAGVAAALDALSLAAAEASTPADALRIALGARELTALHRSDGPR